MSVITLNIYSVSNDSERNKKLSTRSSSALAIAFGEEEFY